MMKYYKFKKVNITYTTFDNKIRTSKGKIPFAEEESLINIIEYHNTKQWPEEPNFENSRRIDWGLERYTPYKLETNTTFQYAYRDCCTESQYTYFMSMLKLVVIAKIATECTENKDFAKALLKEAAIRAKKKDEEHIAWQIANGAKQLVTHDFRNALTRAKNRIRYHQTKADAYYGDEWKHFLAIIEEFELYTVIKIKEVKR